MAPVLDWYQAVRHSFRTVPAQMGSHHRCHSGGPEWRCLQLWSVRFEVRYSPSSDSRSGRPGDLSQQPVLVPHGAWHLLRPSSAHEAGARTRIVPSVGHRHRLLLACPTVLTHHAVVPADRRGKRRRCQFLVCHVLRRRPGNVRVSPGSGMGGKADTSAAWHFVSSTIGSGSTSFPASATTRSARRSSRSPEAASVTPWSRCPTLSSSNGTTRTIPAAMSSVSCHPVVLWTATFQTKWRSSLALEDDCRN